MALTTPDAIRSPNDGDQYALVQDLGVLADSTQVALVRRANMYLGTSTQRTSFTTAADGVHWQDTNGTRRSYIRTGGAWRGVDPLHGTITTDIPAGGGNTTTLVNFPAGYFSIAPQIQLTAYNATGYTANINLNAQSITASSFVIRLDRGAAVTGFTVGWTAFPNY